MTDAEIIHPIFKKVVQVIWQNDLKSRELVREFILSSATSISKLLNLKLSFLTCKMWALTEPTHIT